MSTPRERITEEVRIRNYSPRTVQCYVSMVARFVKQIGKPPAQLAPKRPDSSSWSWSSRRRRENLFDQAVCALRFLCSVTLLRDFAVEHIPLAKRKKPLPMALGAHDNPAFPALRVPRQTVRRPRWARSHAPRGGQPHDRKP